MAMNSFSFKRVVEIFEHDLSSQEFEDLTQTHIRLLKENDQAEPINIEKLKANYVDTSESGRRVAPRYPLKMTVIVYSRSKSIRTSSVNVSLTGVLLNDQLPKEFSDGQVEIVFIHEQANKSQKQFLVFNAQIVDAASSNQRLKFNSAVRKASEDLEKIIEGSKLPPL